jgi:hypothetical protein
MSEKIEDNFENGNFWELYRDLERQFENFLEYVPYLKENENVCSFRLLNLILSIGGHVDSAFKEMARYSEFSENQDCKKILAILKETDENIKEGRAPKTVPIGISLKAFEKEYELSKRKVRFKRMPERETLTPFEPYNPKTNAPKWWEVYNGLKHDAGVNIKEANLQNTLHALASAFLLNVIHIPAILMFYDYRILKIRVGSYSVGRKGREVLRKSFKEKKDWKGWFVETPLFVYNYWRTEING